jgi:cell division protein FtsZ
MVKEGLINLDFADVRTIMAGMGKAMMGTGESSGERRAIEAAEAAISNPLLDDVCMKGASGLLVSITGGNDLTLYEVDEAASRVRAEADPDANIIVGATFDNELDGSIRVSVVATGIGLASTQSTRPVLDAPKPAVLAREEQTDRAACRPCDASRSSRSRRAEPRARPERRREGAVGVARSWQRGDREASGTGDGHDLPACCGPQVCGASGGILPACTTGGDQAARAAHSE